MTTPGQGFGAAKSLNYSEITGELACYRLKGTTFFALGRKFFEKDAEYSETMT